MIQKNMVVAQGFLLLELLVALLLISIFTLIISSYHYSILSGNQETVIRCSIINRAHSVLEALRGIQQLPEEQEPFKAEISFSPLAQPDPIWWIDDYSQKDLEVIDLIISRTSPNDKQYSIHLQTVKV